MMAHSSQSREPHHGQPGVFASFGRVPPCGGDGLANCPRNAFRIGTEQAARSGPRPDGIGEIRGVAGGPATPSTPSVIFHRNFKQPDGTRLHILGTRDRARVIHQACPSRMRGRREGRVAGRTRGPPAIKKAGGSYHKVQPINRPSLRDGVTAYGALSPGTGLSCPRHARDHHLARLTPASGCQDHTASPSVSASLVARHQSSIASRAPRS
jgi:hypothetical protein